MQTWGSAQVPESGLFAVDVDPRHGGQESLGNLQLQHGALPVTMTARTGGGGQHLLFRWPDFDVRNASGILPGIDVRGSRGYIVAWPSNHASQQLPTSGLTTSCRSWRLHRVAPRTSSLREFRNRFSSRQDDSRRRAEFDASRASQEPCVAVGCQSQGILAALQEENALRCRPPLEEGELARVAHSIGRYPPAAGPESADEIADVSESGTPLTVSLRDSLDRDPGGRAFARGRWHHPSRWFRGAGRVKVDSERPLSPFISAFAWLPGHPLLLPRLHPHRRRFSSSKRKEIEIRSERGSPQPWPISDSAKTYRPTSRRGIPAKGFRRRTSVFPRDRTA